jgi:hypothetical protein
MELNHQAVRRNKNTQISPLTPAARDHSSSLDRSRAQLLPDSPPGRREEYGSLLKEQMTVNRIEDEAQASRCRREELENASYCR